MALVGEADRERCVGDGLPALEQAAGQAHPVCDLQDKRVSPLELFFDLVFVLALTQVTAGVSADPTAGGVLRAGC